MISASFAPALLDKGIASTRRVLDKWWKEGVTDAGIGGAQAGAGRQLPRWACRRPAGSPRAILTTRQRGYDVGWLDGYPEAIKALTREQVNAAIKAQLDPSAMVLVEAGSVAPAAAPAPAPSRASHRRQATFSNQLERHIGAGGKA